MKFYAMVCNDIHWVLFFDDWEKATEYFYVTFPDETKQQNEGVRIYTRKNKLFVKYPPDYMFGNVKKDTYTLQEVSLVNVLNWLATESRAMWVIRNVLERQESASTESESKAD